MYLIRHMSDVLKTVRPVVIILLEIKCALSKHREGEADVSAVVEVIK